MNEILVFMNYNLCIGGVSLYAVDAVHAGLLGLVAFGYGYYLAVACLEAETELAGLIGIYFKLGMGKLFEAFHCLVFYTAHAVLAYALYAVKAGILALVALGGSDNFAVTGLKVEYKAGLGGLNYEFSHFSVSFLILGI